MLHAIIPEKSGIIGKNGGKLYTKSGPDFKLFAASPGFRVLMIMRGLFGKGIPGILYKNTPQKN
jgi:hypothetical protein